MSTARSNGRRQAASTAAPAREQSALEQESGGECGNRAKPGKSNGVAARAASKGMTRSFNIPSDFAATQAVQQQIMDDVDRCGFNRDCAFAIRLALEEALVNAIKHGNREDRSKVVRIRSTITHGRAEIVVEDEGCGFSRYGVPDPTADENLCRPNGRGILLIESYMTRATWDKGGRRLRMVKRNDDCR